MQTPYPISAPRHAAPSSERVGGILWARHEDALHPGRVLYLAWVPDPQRILKPGLQRVQMKLFLGQMDLLVLPKTHPRYRLVFLYIERPIELTAGPDTRIKQRRRLRRVRRLEDFDA